MVPGLLRRMFILYPLDRTFCMYLLNTIDLWSNLTPYSPCWVVLWMTYAKMREGLKSPTVITQETNGPYISFCVHFELICCVCAFLYMLLHTCAGVPGLMYICVCLPEDNLVYNVSRASHPVFFFWDRVSHWPPVQYLDWSGCPDAPGICLSQFPQCWDCKSKPWWLTVLYEFWSPISGPHACIANTLLSEPSF